MSREGGTHVREDGSAKISYPTRELAAIAADSVWMATGRQHNVYLCSQRPEHYHVGKGAPNLERSN